MCLCFWLWAKPAHCGATLINTIGVPGVAGPSIGFNPALLSAANTEADVGFLWSNCTINPVWPFIMRLPCPTATWTPGTVANTAPRSEAKRSRFGMNGMMLIIAPDFVVSRIARFASSVSGLGVPLGAIETDGGGDGVCGAFCNRSIACSACDIRRCIPSRFPLNAPMVTPSLATSDLALPKSVASPAACRFRDAISICCRPAKMVSDQSNKIPIAASPASATSNKRQPFSWVVFENRSFSRSTPAQTATFDTASNMPNPSRTDSNWSLLSAIFLSCFLSNSALAIYLLLYPLHGPRSRRCDVGIRTALPPNPPTP